MNYPWLTDMVPEAAAEICGDLSGMELVETLMRAIDDPTPGEGPTLAESVNTDPRLLASLLYPLFRPLVVDGLSLEDIGNLSTAPVNRFVGWLVERTRKAIIQIASRTAYVVAKSEILHSKYLLSEGLAAQLCETEIRGLRCGDLHLPFQDLALNFPSMPRDFETGAGAGTLRSALLHETENRRWVCVCDCKNPGNSGTLTMIYADLANPDLPLEQAFCEERADGGVSSQFGTFLANVIVYATWPDAEVDHVILNPHARKLWEKIERTPKCKRRERLEAVLSGMDTRKTYVLGRSVIYVSRQRAMENDHAAGRTGAKLLAYQRIPGHWKNQPFGPRHSLRRRQWIQPYVRGPEYGVLSEPIHKLVGGASP